MMKIMLLTHGSDIDGLGAVVLSKIVFKNLDYFLFPNIDELENFVNLTRLEDTWEWKKRGKLGLFAHDLVILFNICL